MPMPITQSRSMQPPVPLEQLAKHTTMTEREKVGEVCRHFEAMLLRQFLGEANKPMFTESGGMSPAMKGVYQDMIVDSLSDQISRAGGFGLGRTIQSQLIPKNLAEAVKKPVETKP